VNRGAALVVLAAICFATLGPASRYAFAAGVDPLTLVTWRATIGLLFVIGAGFVLGRRGQLVARPLSEIPRRHQALNVVAGLAGGLLNLMVLIAITRISITLALLVFFVFGIGLFVKGVFVVGARHLDSRIRSGALGVKAPLAPGPALAYTLAPLRLVASAREGDPGGMRGKPSLRCEPSKPEISATALRIPRPRAQNNTNRLSSEWS